MAVTPPSDFSRYYFLDLTALGRQEDREAPEGRRESACRGRCHFAS